MARTFSWIQRVNEIRRTVTDSVRSVYTRAELQELFQIQQSPATRLMDVLPTVRMNMGLLVTREELKAFLDRVEASEDVTGLMRQMKKEKTAPSRRKLRSLVRRDVAPVGFEGMPANLTLERGYMGIKFDTLDELVTTEFYVARLLQDELEEFARRFEPVVEREPNRDKEEVERMFAEIDATTTSV